MKKILFFVFAMILAVACYDDTALWDELKDHESRIVKLETLCNQMNTNISSLQSIVAALQEKDYVTNVAPIKENGKEIGYTITFSKSGSITIYHGTNGKDGADGHNGKDGEAGKDGYTPVLGVKQDTDGVYYWTLDGEWLTDASGNKIPTTGSDGADGSDGANGEDGKDGEDGTDGKDGLNGTDGITPQLKIEESDWYISYDNGQTWERLGKAVGEDGKDGKDGENGDSFFRSVTQDDENVYITLVDGTEFVLPKAKQSNVTIALNDIKDGSVIFTGNVAETSVDLKVTVYYSMDKNLTVYNYDGKVSVTDFDNNTFSLVLDGLAPATQYYYFTEVVFNGTVEYSDIETFYITLADAGIYFSEDFSWVAPWVDAYGSEDSVGDDNASGKAANVYTQTSHLEYDGVGYVNGGAGVKGYPSFLTEFAERGYENVNAAVQALYTQKYYLKFGKTNAHTGIKLPAMELEGAETTDVVLSFDWSAHINARGNVDDVKIVVELEGEGVCADSQSKISLPVSPDQEQGDMKWQNVKLLLKDVNSATRITIRPTVLDNSDGVEQKRWYIDNIRVAKAHEEVVAEWLFTADAMTAYADNFGTIDGLVDLNPGDGGQFVDANVSGSGRITYVQVDKNGLELQNANTQPFRSTGSTGHPYVRGCWIGDYWLFEADANSTYPAGTNFSINYMTRTSNTGLKYWRVEYLDGETWKPAMPVKAATVNEIPIEYNLVMVNDASINVTVAPVVTLTSPTKGLKFRMIALVNVRTRDEEVVTKLTAGTCRIAGAEGTSPVIKVIK